MARDRAETALRERVIGTIDDAAGDILAVSKFIHAHPEVAMEEFASAKAVADMLERYGFTTARGIAGLPTAFRAEKGEGAPRVAFLSEYDALPGIGHACGHNLIACAAMGAGIGLAAALGDVSGSVVVFGTPAEEAIGGKVIMARHGVFDDIDAAMGAHPGTIEASVPTEVGSGLALAVSTVVAEFHGKPAHAAADPYNGINALNAVIETFNGINALRQHITPEARIHGIITHGGDAPNIVPAYARAVFYVRAGTVRAMEELVAKVRRIAAGAGEMTGARLEWSRPEEPYTDMVTNYTLARRVRAHFDSLGLHMPLPRTGEALGSTDWGNVSYLVPAVETGFPITETIIPWHSAQVVAAADSDLGYRNMLLAAKAMALAGLDLLMDGRLLRAVKEEHRRALAERAGDVAAR
jgi:amidohydrolase